MFFILFYSQRHRFSGWGTLCPPPSTGMGLEPQSLAPTGASSGCVYRITMPSAPRAPRGGPGGTGECWSSFLVIYGESLCPERSEGMQHRSTQFSNTVFIHEFATCGPVVAAVWLRSQLEVFRPPHPVDRNCWFQG